jgi:hypothetical protein
MARNGNGHVAVLAAAALSAVVVGCAMRSDGDNTLHRIAAPNHFLVVHQRANAAADNVPTGSELAAVSGPAAARPAAAAQARAPVPAYQTHVPGQGSLVAYLRGERAVLWLQPGRRTLARVARRTEFGSLRVLAVVARAQHGRWLKVIAPELPNNHAAWVDAREVWLRRVRWSLVADLSRRTVTVFRDHRAVGSFPVAVGRAGSETPRGVFSVTDKLLVTDRTPYGCCALALSGHQPNVVQGWGGGDRIAIHATDKPYSIGYAASLGCLRAPEKVMRRLVYRIPLGARVFVHD